MFYQVSVRNPLQRRIQKFQKRGGAQSKTWTVETFWWDKLLVSAYAGLRLPTCAFCHISPFNTLIFCIGVSRPSVAFCVRSVRQFNATLYLSRTPIVHITTNVKRKHTHTLAINYTHLVSRAKKINWCNQH